MKFLLGTKVGMTQIFSEDGRVIPVTVIEAMPNTVSAVKNEDKDGYRAIQVGMGARKKISKPLAGHLKDLGSLRHLKEFRVPDGAESELKRGDTIDVSAFKEGDVVHVSGLNKAKGFQGVVKRHGFGGGRKTHGQKHSLREPGSIGATFPERVIKGKRMAGRMGGERITVKNLIVVKIDPELHVIALRGAVPGRKGTLIEIRAAKKEAKS